MDMAFSGMDKDERQASGTDFWEGVDEEKVYFVGVYRASAIENA